MSESHKSPIRAGSAKQKHTMDNNTATRDSRHHSLNTAGKEDGMLLLSRAYAHAVVFLHKDMKYSYMAPE